MAFEVKAWVGNLGKYNEGELVGEWVTFPIDEDDWDEVLRRIHIGEQVDPNDARYGIYEEIFFADYDSELPLFKEYGEYPTLEQLNELAEEVEDIDDEDILLAIYNEHSVTLSDAIAVYKSGDWRFYPHCDDMGDVAKQICADDPRFDNVANDFLVRHFDYDSYGEELDSCGTFVPCGNGYLEIWG